MRKFALKSPAWFYSEFRKLLLRVAISRIGRAKHLQVSQLGRRQLTPKGGRGCRMSLSPLPPPPGLESQGCHLIQLYDLLSYSSAFSCCSCCLVFFLPTDSFSRLFFFKKILQYFSVRVWGAGESFLLGFSSSFFFFFVVVGIDRADESPRYQHS